MKLLVTTNGRLYKNSRNEYYTPMVYDYAFFERYLQVFETVRLLAHVEKSDADLSGMVRVDGPNLEIYGVHFPHGKMEYICAYQKIQRQLKQCAKDCDAAIFRVPDQLAFQAFPLVKKLKLPVGVEVTSSSWDFFETESTKGFFRPVLRIMWDVLQKKACRTSDASCYVTRSAIQKRYPPSSIKETFTTYCSDVDLLHFINIEHRYSSEKMKQINVLHVAGSIDGHAKGHLELLQALTILKKNGVRVNCTLVGGGELAPDCQDIVNQNSLSVVCSGILNAQQVAQKMQEADLFVFPSYREGLPRVLIEAMATGLVCVATELAGIMELLDKEMTVPVRDANALALKILEVLSAPQVLKQQSEKNKQKAMEYLPECMLKRRYDFYSYLYRRAINAKQN